MKKLAAYALVAVVLGVAALVYHGQNSKLVAPSAVTEAELGATVFPVYVNNNGKYGSNHSLVFGGIGRDFAQRVVRIGEDKGGSDPIELFWIDRYEKIEGKEGAVRVYILGEYGESRIFIVTKGATSTVASPEFSSWE